MDVISLGKAMQAKKKMDALEKRVGLGVKGEYANVDERLKVLEAKEVGLVTEIYSFGTLDDWNTGVLSGETAILTGEGVIPGITGVGEWLSQQIDLGENLISVDFLGIEGEGLIGVVIETKSENDASFKPLGVNGSILSKHGKFLTVKVQMTEDSVGATVTGFKISYKRKPLTSRLSEMAAHTRINLNKHNLQVNALLNRFKYRLNDMVFDDFVDFSGVEGSLSKNILHRQGKIIMNNKQEAAEIITVKESLSSVPSAIFVSQESNDLSVINTLVDLSTRKGEGTIYSEGAVKLDFTREGEELPKKGIFEIGPIDQGTNFKNYLSVVPVISTYESEQAVPIMSSEILGSIVTTSSGSSSSTYPHWKIFNRTNINYLDMWNSNNTPTGWVQVDFGEGQQKTIGKYSLETRDYSTFDYPSSWRILGSKTGAFSGEEVVLDERQDVIFTSPKESKEFYCQNLKNFRFIRMDIYESKTSSGGVNSSAFYLSKWDMFETTGSIDLHASLSNDGVNFTEPIGLSEIINSTKRYLKITGELRARFIDSKKERQITSAEDILENVNGIYIFKEEEAKEKYLGNIQVWNTFEGFKISNRLELMMGVKEEPEEERPADIILNISSINVLEEGLKINGRGEIVLHAIEGGNG